MRVTRKEALEFLREHYGLTLDKVMKLVNTHDVLHPQTLRDDFAKSALTGIISTSTGPYFRQDKLLAELIARNAYEIADAMLEERLK
jgi:hypothetical protein